ncbi:MAG: hypothetical protein JWN82_426 [Candidatus Saccharibacteria bacterium]|nr:hypothetical protein [Candidatus Saccharibacteria bacterium]
MSILPNGIEHGPYSNIPDQELEIYLSDPERFGAPIDMTLEQFIADRESEWQYDQHCAAVKKAATTINPDTGKPYISPNTEAYFLEKVLRSWWIGSRRPGEYKSQF